MIKHNYYSGYKREYFQMRDLLISSIRKYNKPLNWLIGRLDNWRYASFTKIIREKPWFYQENAHLWKDDLGKLIGFFISENGKDDFELQIDPQYRKIEAEMIGWVLKEWAADKKQLITTVYKYDDFRQKILKKCGFISSEILAVDFRLDTQNYDAPVFLPNGYAIEPFSKRYDYEDHIETQRLAFGRRKDQLDREWFETKVLAPGYDSDWDLMIITPKGKPISFCLAWIDWENKIAEIDPVGTHPDYRRKGFARYLLLNCFFRLNKAGIREAQIIGFSDAAKALYDSLKPARKYNILKYVKDLEK